MPEVVTDERILERMGLTDKELRDAEVKFSDFVKTLDPAQRNTLKKSTPTAEAAARTLGPGVTAERLMEFIRSRAQKDAAMLIMFNGEGG
jgi:hypothetical protein